MLGGNSSRASATLASVRPSGVALLLSQLGANASARFARRLEALDLTPAHVGVLRVVGQQPGLSQQALAQQLGAAPSRVVKLIDELEQRGLVRRQRSDTDRRNYALHIDDQAADRVAAVRQIVGQHDVETVAPLSADEVELLRSLLTKLADAQGLGTGAHPGYGRPTEA